MKKQEELIAVCFEALDVKDNEHDIENATRHLEQMFWRSTTAKKLYWTASHLLQMYTFWEFFNLHNLTPDEFESRHSWKYTIAKNNYEKNKEIFEKRDKLVLSKLKEIESKYYIPYSELVKQKEFFPNMISSYSESLEKTLEKV